MVSVEAPEPPPPEVVVPPPPVPVVPAEAELVVPPELLPDDEGELELPHAAASSVSAAAATTTLVVQRPITSCLLGFLARGSAPAPGSTTSEQGPRPFPKPFTRPYAHLQRPAPGVHRSRCAGVSHPSASLATMAPTPRVPRERTEEIERTTLSERATLSSETKGREREEAPDRLRAAFQRDRDRIVHAKAFRRLKHKTQVFLSPEGDHYRVRLTHTLEVSQIAR